MRIYMAGFFAGRGVATTSSIHFRVSQMVNYPWLLESFHYVNPAMIKEIRRLQKKVFLDSGAFSMFTQGVQVDLKAYARFIYEHQDMIDVASNLDAIGAGNEQLSYERQKQLESWLKPKGLIINPVHHARDKDPWLQKYLDEGYDYIFLGGMVPENTPYLKEWLDHVWHHYLTDKDGKPKVKVHGFGLTTLSLMFRYPWYSVDSTSWVMTSRFGSIYMDLPQPDGSIKDCKVDFSSRSPKQEDINSWHYNSLTKAERHKILERLEELEAVREKNLELETELEKATGYKHSYNPKAFAESYGWRDHFNINYFRRAQERAVKTFKKEQGTLFT